MEKDSCANVCLAEKENGHADMYLTTVHQSDGFEYAKCDVCGWIKPESVSRPAPSGTAEEGKKDYVMCCKQGCQYLVCNAYRDENGVLPCPKK